MGVDGSLDTRRRLSAIKALLNRAESACDEPAPFWWEAISRLHDAAEMFLCVICDVHNVTPADKNFMDFWSRISEKTEKRLGYFSRMKSVNDLRNGFKHRGTVPNHDELIKARDTVHDLVYDETPRYFEGLSIEELNLIDLVTNDKARGYLEKAIENWGSDERNASAWAFGYLKVTFDEVIRSSPTTAPSGVFGLASVSSDRTILTNIRSWGTGRGDVNQGLLNGLSKVHSQIEESLQQVNLTAVLGGLGIDLKRYARFLQKAPGASEMAGGRVVLSLLAGVSTEYTQQDFDSNLDFVVSTFLHLEGVGGLTATQKQMLLAHSPETGPTAEQPES